MTLPAHPKRLSSKLMRCCKAEKNDSTWWNTLTLRRAPLPSPRARRITGEGILNGMERTGICRSYRMPERGTDGNTSTICAPAPIAPDAA